MGILERGNPLGVVGKKTPVCDSEVTKSRPAVFRRPCRVAFCFSMPMRGCPRGPCMNAPNLSWRFRGVGQSPFVTCTGDVFLRINLVWSFAALRAACHSLRERSGFGRAIGFFVLITEPSVSGAEVSSHRSKPGAGSGTDGHPCEKCEVGI